MTLRTLQSGMVTLDTVAAHARVSKATASRVLGGRAAQLVSPRTAERVRQSAQALGYKLNPVAAALATGKSKVVALCLSDIDRPFYARFQRELGRQARDAGYEMIVQQGSIAKTPGWPVDGVVAFDLVPPTDMPRSATFVAVGEWPPENTDAIQFDLASATRQALETLIASGRRKVAYLRQDATAKRTTGRYATVESVLRQHALSPIHIRVDTDTADAGHDAVARYLAEGGDCDSLFCHNDELAIGALQALREAGRDVPGQVALVGCDGIEWTRFTAPSISTLDIPLSEAAKRAWGTLVWRWENPDADPVRHTVTATYIPRQTTPNQKESP